MAEGFNLASVAEQCKNNNNKNSPLYNCVLTLGVGKFFFFLISAQVYSCCRMLCRQSL